MSVVSEDELRFSAWQGERRKLGARLVAVGDLSAADLQRVLERQRTDVRLFGEIAVSMGLLDSQQVDRELANQSGSCAAEVARSRLSKDLHCAHESDAPSSEAIRRLRNALLLRLAGRSRSLAVVSAGAREGRSRVCANLALSLAQAGHRTLLIDADMRRPVQHELFGLDTGSGLSGLLASENGAAGVRYVCVSENLYVLRAGPLPSNPAELVCGPGLSELTRQAGDTFDWVLWDTPAGDVYSETMMLAAAAGAAVLVTRVGVTQIENTRRFVQRLTGNGIDVVGKVVLES